MSYYHVQREQPATIHRIFVKKNLGTRTKSSKRNKNLQLDTLMKNYHGK